MTYIACVFFLIAPSGAFGFIDRIIYGEWSGKPGDKFTEALNGADLPQAPISRELGGS
jgi:hypothetical protein